MGKPNARARILEVAGRLFHERGYTAVGINEIIEVAETAKATFYHHFPTKRALGEAWLAGVHEDSEAGRAAILEKDEPACEKVRDYFRALRRFLVGGGFRGCPYTNTAAVVTPGEEGLMDEVVKHKESVRTFLRGLAVQIVGKRGKEANRLGDRLFLLYSGATTEAQNLKATWPVDVAAEEAVALCGAAKGD